MIGAGYVGLVSAACFSEFGWTVTCVDKDLSKIENLREGQLPIYEPRLDELLRRNLRMGRIDFATDLAPSIGGAGRYQPGGRDPSQGAPSRRRFRSLLEPRIPARGLCHL